MTGKISALAAGKRTGTIRGQDGVLFLFSADAVLGDYNALAVGDQVSFDAGRARFEGGVERVFREPVPAMGGAKKQDAVDLRFLGFDQAAGVRRYRFDSVAQGRSVQHLVTVELALLLKHRVAVQEAPALCLRKLAADLKSSPDSVGHKLGEDDLLVFTSSRAAALQRKRPRSPFGGRHGSPPPAPSNHTRFS